jgi:hypothetical protein
MRRHDVKPIADLQLPRHPVGEGAARNLLHGDLERPIVRRGAERIIAPHLFAADHRAKRQMLPSAVAEGVGQLRQNIEADGAGFGRLLHDFSYPQRMEMLFAHQLASG